MERAEPTNAVQWAITGSNEPESPEVSIFIDAERSQRTIFRHQTAELVSRLAGAFEPGSTVCVHAANDTLYPILILAILASGCVYTGSNPVYTQKELKHHLTASEAKYVVTTADLLKNVEPAVREADAKIEIIIFSDLLNDAPPANESGYKTLHDMWRPIDLIDLTARMEKVDPTSIATLMATSGTTGLPKLAARTHAALLAEVKAIAAKIGNKTYEVRNLICLPIFHAFAFPITTFIALRLGQPTYILKRFGDAFSYRVRDHSVTDILATPSMLLSLEESAKDDIDIKADLQTLKTIYCGGAPLAKGLSERFLGLFHERPRLVDVYGLTECGWVSMSEGEDDGKVLDGLELRLDESTITTLSDGQKIGELGVKGKQVMTGYKNDIDATKEAMGSSDWLKTGDIGLLDSNDTVRLVDRAKDILKIDGFAVSPTEFEWALREIGEVEDVAVISSGPNSEDEHPVIFIVKKEGEGDLTAAKVRQHLMGKMSRYKVAKCRTRFVASIPRGEDEKTLREELRKQLAQ